MSGITEATGALSRFWQQVSGSKAEDMTGLGYNKIIDAADFARPELEPYLREIAQDEMIRFGLDKPEIIPDSKQWECAMMMRAFHDHGLIKPGNTFAGIGAGTEQTTFVLASKGCVTFPTDRYLELTPWSDVAPAAMMARPRQYASFDYPLGGVIPVHTDARRLDLPSNFFDGVYSAGSIEHFGSLEAVEAAAEEIGRILKPGGIAAISTEFRLEGPNDRGWFDDNCILFTPDLLQKHIVGPSGLELVDPLMPSTSSATYNSQVVLLDFLAKAVKVRSIEDKRNAYPNLVLFHEGFLFCSVHLCLRKPAATSGEGGARSRRFVGEIEENAVAVSGALTQQIRQWQRRFRGEAVIDDAEAEALQHEAAATRARVAELESIIVEARLATDAGDRPALPDVDWVEERHFAVDQLYSQVGQKNDFGIDVAGVSGVLCFGPYTPLEAGRYRAVFDATFDGNTATVLADVCYGEGPRIVACRHLDRSPEDFSLDFALSEGATGIEFRLNAAEPVSGQIRGVTILRARPAAN